MRQKPYAAEYRIFRTPQSNLKKLVSLSLMLDMIGCVSSTNQNQKCLPI